MRKRPTIAIREKTVDRMEGTLPSFLIRKTKKKKATNIKARELMEKALKRETRTARKTETGGKEERMLPPIIKASKGRMV